MTLRLKLNLAMMSVITVFAVAAGFTLWAVSRNACQTRLYSRMRELGRLTSDIRTDVYHQLAFAGGGASPRREPNAIPWPKYVFDDIDVQISLASTPQERAQWQRLRTAIDGINDQLVAGVRRPHAEVREAEHCLLELRNSYNVQEFDAIAATASTGFLAQAAITAAGVLTVVLFLAYLIMVRDWLVHPIEILKSSTDEIGRGALRHRIPLQGSDELATLARRIELMAERLAANQKELLESRELSAIGELCTNVAHGLRNPLASLRASAQLAGRRAGNAEETERAVLEIVRQVDRLDDRITRLFEFSRPCQPTFGCTNFEDLAEAARIEAGASLEAQDMRVRVTNRTDGAVWCLDGAAIVSVLAELITNATHHSAPGSVVELRASYAEADADENVLQIQVIDTGKGMPAATMEKAFDLFFTSRPSGAGMGLAMARKAIIRHQGTIELESEPDRGTTVTLELPRRCRASTEAKDAAERRDGSRCRHCQGAFVHTRSTTL